MTTQHVIDVTGLEKDNSKEVVRELRTYGLVYCLTPQARRSRLYWLTPLGIQCCNALRIESGLPAQRMQLPSVSWDAYAFTCFAHRSAILRNLHTPSRVAALREGILFAEPGIKLSDHALRDCLHALEDQGLVTKETLPHLLYDLTPLGKELQHLHIQARTSQPLFPVHAGKEEVVSWFS